MYRIQRMALCTSKWLMTNGEKLNVGGPAVNKKHPQQVSHFLAQVPIDSRIVWSCKT